MEPVSEGDVAYLVSTTWVAQALSIRSESKSSSASASLGPVDNSDIIQEVLLDASGRHFVRLVPGSGLESFKLFPETAWKLVVDWYGIKDGQHPITRTAVNTADSKQAPPNIIYDLHPPVFRIHRLWSEMSPLPIEQSIKDKNPPPLLLVRSATSHAQSFLRELKTLAGVPISRKIRLFTLPSSLPRNASLAELHAAPTPPDSPDGALATPSPASTWPNLLLDIATFAQVRESRVQVQLADSTMKDKFNGSSALQHYNLITDQTLVIDEAIENSWVSTFTGTDSSSKSFAAPRAGSLEDSPNSRVKSSSPALEGPLTRSRAQMKRGGRSHGAVGLHNLGNTCYMNSALQCFRSVEELTKYFLTESYLAEINHTNVLGYEGRVAMAYGQLVREIYQEGRGVVMPRDFKATVGRCRPTFSGWSQQDSQEFLGFLLDALQEDLSRIKKKPYIEKPDSTDDMINNPEAIRELADKVWDITRKRDDSVIADLFTGMYKSTLKCPECGKISITFDPFNNLTLPLPIENVWSKPIKFFPLNGPPIKIEVELSKHSSIEVLKQFISDRTGVPVDRLMGADEFKDHFVKIYENSQDISEEILSSDIATMHELEAVPTNWPIRAEQRRLRSMLDVESPYDSLGTDDERCEILVVPVFHRRPHSSSPGLEGSCPPHFITLTRGEAFNLDTIRRKVLERVATFSTWSKFSGGRQEAEEMEPADSDAVTAISDADSSGDGKVAAHSVEGEDDMVDITMAAANDGGMAPKHRAKTPGATPFGTRRPKFSDPKNFLDAELQNLFDLCFFPSDGGSLVPNSWTNVDESRLLPKLSDRINGAKEDGGVSPESPESAGSGNEDSSVSNAEETEPVPSHTRMMDESSDEEPCSSFLVGLPPPF